MTDQHASTEPTDLPQSSPLIPPPQQLPPPPPMGPPTLPPPLLHSSPDQAPPDFSLLGPTPVKLSSPVRSGCGLLEWLLFALGLALLMTGEVFINKPKLIFDGPFVLDECLTDSIVRDSNISQSIQAVKHGVDTNPPVYHLILRAFWMGATRLFPDCSSRIALRTFSMICTWLALAGVYWILRKGFCRAVALVAVLAVWAHPIVVEQSANARFYGPLLLASVAMVWSAQIRGSGILRGVVVALCAMILCTLHYFGILILGPIVLAMLLVDEATAGRRIIRILPALAGPLALLPFLPFVRSQAQGLTVHTWVDPFTFHTARDFVTEVLCPLPLLIAVVIFSTGKMMPRKVVFAAPVDPLQKRLASVPMLSLILVPAVIVVFSAVVQSALIPRYAIAAALPLAAFVALLAERRSVWLLFVLAILLSGFTILELHSVSASRAGDSTVLNNERDELNRDPTPLPMVFADRAGATTLATFAPDMLTRISILDQRDPAVELRNFRTYEIEMVDKVRPFYPRTTPALITAGDLQKMGQFHLIAAAEDMQNILLESPMRHVESDRYETLNLK